VFAASHWRRGVRYTSTRVNVARWVLIMSRVLVTETGFVLVNIFIKRTITNSHLITLTYRQYSAIADIHIFQFTVVHALEFSPSTSRFPATDLNTGIITISLNQTLQILPIKSSILTIRSSPFTNLPRLSPM
jgi:hypothetical protein